MANVINVSRDKAVITIQYNVSYGGGSLFVGSGAINTTPFYETIHYTKEEDAKELFDELSK